VCQQKEPKKKKKKKIQRRPRRLGRKREGGGGGVASRRRKEIDTLPHPISFLSFPSPHLPILLRGSEREHGAKAIFHILVCSRSFPAAVSVSVVSDQKTHSTSCSVAYGAVVFVIYPWALTSHAPISLLFLFIIYYHGAL